MRTRLKYLFKICFIGLLLLSTEISHAQRKNIIINNDLSNNADMMKVKMGTQWMGRIWKFKFGDYAVEKSKMGWKVIEQKANILHTKNEYKSGYKFNFVLSNKTSDSAIVKAVYSNNINELESIELFPNIYFGSDEILKDSLSFTADISLNNTIDNKWKLFLKRTSGSEIEYKNEGVLVNGDRIISIIFVNSNLDGNDKRWFPALGYEFMENEKAICALQYFGGGALGYNKNIIWIDSSLNQKMKLILAAAMTAILQIKSPGG